MAVVGSPETVVSRQQANGGRRIALPGTVPWFLIAILAAQAGMSLRLVWANTAFLDEATYLLAGHVELAHWLHGTPEPAYSTYLSGAPAIYPPLAALAASLAGLAGARLLSLAFMLGATALLWGMTARLFGRPAAYLAAALFAALGPTQFLGAFATYDAMSLFLMALAAWCVTAASDRGHFSWLVIAGAALLALANATKYASLLFDPVVMALGGLAAARSCQTGPSTGSRPVERAVTRAALTGVIVLALNAALLLIGGSSYVTGITSTTIARAAGQTPASLVLTDSGKWIGAALIPAVLALVLAVARRRSRVETAIVGVLAAAAVLAPFEQARIHTLQSLSKHVDYGAWFAAAAAGYLVAQLASAQSRRQVATTAAVAVSAAALVPAAVAGLAQSAGFYQAWANTTQLTNKLAALVRQSPGPCLAEDYQVPAYYLQDQVRWQQWSGTWGFDWRDPGTQRTLTGLPAYTAAIEAHYFSLVILNFADTTATDRVISAAVRRSGAYRLVATLPDRDSSGAGQVMVWRYQPRRPGPDSGK